MKGRRRIRKYALALLGIAIIGPLIAFGISNLFLLSPKGRELIAGKIGNRLHLETSVQGATWSPWNGITVYGILIKQPGVLRDAIGIPLLTVQSLQVHPSWQALLKRELAIKGVEIVKPELHVPIELLSQIPQAADAPALAAATPPPASGPMPGAIASNPAPSPPPAETAAPVVEEQPPQQEPSAPQDKTPNVWINARDGKLGIVSLMSPSPLFVAEGIDGSVAVSGKPAKSRVSISKLSGMGQQAPGKISIPLNWSAPVLGAKITGKETFGFDFLIEGHLALVQGIPFRIDASAPEQGDREIRFAGKTIARLGRMASQGRTEGYLQIPASWQGKWIARASGVDLEIAGHASRFDHGQALLLFQGGALRCIDARLSGDDATIIGNGMILSDGRMAANTRIVAAPETLASVSRFIQPGTETYLTPLSTPQRAALDLQVFGQPGNLHYKPNPRAAPIPLQ